MSNLNQTQFGSQPPTSTNATRTSTNGQSERSATASSSTTTVIAVKGSAPSISTRST